MSCQLFRDLEELIRKFTCRITKQEQLGKPCKSVNEGLGTPATRHR